MEVERIDRTQMAPIRMEKPDWSDNGEPLPVYKVKLSDLYYNADNGRIATWISGYPFEHDKPLESLSRDDFNDIVETYIVNSESNATLRKTRENIEQIGQIRPGVILEDGRVLSGNRRFTCLRQLYRKHASSKFEYFECFILDLPKDKDGRQRIKDIERMTQFGVNEKQDYNPVEKLVDIYNILINPETKLWSPNEYSKRFDVKIGVVKLMVSKAEIMVEFLEFIGKPRRFDIARANKLDGPLQELANLRNSIEEKEWNRIKNFLYSKLYKTITEKNARTNSMRGAIDVYKKNSDRFEAALTTYNSDIEKTEDQYIASLASGKPAEIKPNPISQPTMSAKAERQLDKAIDETKKQMVVTKPIEQVDASAGILDKIDLDIVKRMDDKNKNDLKKAIEKLQEKINKLLENF